MEGSFSNPGYISVDLIEEGRRDIYKWRDKRRTKRAGVHGTLYKITKLFITRSLVRSFMHNLSVVVAFQMILAAICTYACVKLGLEIDVHMSLFVSPIVFPLAFSINANYQRRETVLEDLAMFKSASSILFFCHRDWIKACTELPIDLLKTLSNKLKFLVVNIREYLLTENSQKRKFILQVIYEDFSDIAQLNDKIRTSPLKSNSALVARIIHCHNLMCWSFERLRVIREYNSPRSLRAFTKVFIFLMPLLLSPYYVFSGRQTQSTWAPYYISVMVSFLFGSLQAVQDKLDDPFDGIGEDDVNLTQLDDWTTQSLLTNRTVTIGRFTVTTTSAQNQHCSNISPPSHANEQGLHEGGSPKKTRHLSLIEVGSPTKLRRILSRKNERKNEERRSMLDLDETEFTDQLEARCHGIASKLEGLSGTTMILPGNRVPYVFQEYQGLKSPGGTLSTPEYPTSPGNSLKVPGFRLDNRLDVVNECDEEHSPTLDDSPIPQNVLFNMKSDAVIKPEEPSKSRPTVLGLFASPHDDRGNTHSPPDEQCSTCSKVSDNVFPSPDKTDEITLVNRGEVSLTSSPPEELPLLPMNGSSSAPAARVESGSSFETPRTPSSDSEEQLHTQGGTSEADSAETDGFPKLRFCLVGKRGTRGKSEGGGLWGKRKHKKKRPPSSEGKGLSESDSELTGTNSMSPLLPDESRTESLCSDTKEPVFAYIPSDSEITAGIESADNAFSNRGNAETGTVDHASADLGSSDHSSAVREALKPIKTDFMNTESENKDGEVKNPQIVVNSPTEEETSLWDFDMSLEKPSDSEIEKRFSDTTQNEETSNERVECDRIIPQNMTSLPGETSISGIPSSKNNIPASRFAVSRNSNDFNSENTRISKPSSENTIPTEQRGSRFSVSRNSNDLDSEKTSISKPSSENTIPAEQRGSRFAVSRNSNDLDSEKTKISKPSSENIPTEQGGSRFAVSKNSNDLDSENTRISKPTSSRFTISPS